MRTIVWRLLLSAAFASSCVLAVATPTSAAPAYRKVVVIAEENHTYSEVASANDAPYLHRLMASYGSATNMSANYPVSCPSLAGYILMTSGTTDGICDDQGPSAHHLTGNNIFAQVAAAGLSWRTYAEHAPGACARQNTADGLFLVRHTPVAYYTTDAARCAANDVPLGTGASGALHTAIVTGTLPSYSFVVPDACHDMHGAGSCPDHLLANGDAWLSGWIPALMSGPDYRAGRLVIIVTWDEGSRASNHIPTVVISPTTHGPSATAYNHCSTLRTTEEILHLPLLGCARTAPSMTAGFGI
jgi:hypothetical protein